MKAIDIIDALTRMGSTENTGLVETPENADEIQDWLRRWFGGDCDSMQCDRDLKPNTKYVYSYDEQLWSVRRYITKEDCIIHVEHVISEDGRFVTTYRNAIYLYEVE